MSVDLATHTGDAVQSLDMQLPHMNKLHKLDIHTGLAETFVSYQMLLDCDYGVPHPCKVGSSTHL